MSGSRNTEGRRCRTFRPVESRLLPTLRWCLQLGAEAVFVGSGIFKSEDPEARAKAIVKATTYFNDPEKLLEASEDLGMAMPGLEISKLPEAELMQTRGW